VIKELKAKYGFKRRAIWCRVYQSIYRW
jgi:hypothetical protein